MSREELIDVLNTLNTLYPMAFNNVQSEKRREIYIKQFTKHLGDLKFCDVEKAIEDYVAEDETNKSPTLAVIRRRAIKVRDRRLFKEGKSYRRIETPEEAMANIFHEEMSKPHNKRDYFLLERTKFYAGLFQDDEAYKKYFGKSREEFEAL